MSLGLIIDNEVETMKIEHIAMYVLDLEVTRDFFMTYFSATCNEKYHNPETGLQTYFLSFPKGGRLEIMTRPNLYVDNGRERDPHQGVVYRTGFTHMAFALGSKDAVDQLTQRLKSDGYTVLDGPRTTGDGYYESVVEGPEGNLLELTV